MALLRMDIERHDRQSEDIRTGDMAGIPGGTFRMGSDRHYPEEAPAHRITVDGFWIDRTPVTNGQFRELVNSTGYVTFAEIPPDPKLAGGGERRPIATLCVRQSEKHCSLAVQNLQHGGSRT